ncbi:EamA family transporter [soil metagenome]
MPSSIRAMTRRSWIQFLSLSAVWGASYLFIKVALEDVSPAMVVFVRTALASLVLLPFAIRSGALDALRGRPGTVAILALLQVAAPFLLISVGEQELSSSLTGILVATAPIFTFLLAIRLEREARAQGPAVFGVALGIAGVVLLLGIDAGGGSEALIGGLMVVLASLGYALGAFYLRRNLSDAPPIGVVASAMGASALMMAPLAAITFPSEVPGLDTFGSLLALGVGGTGIAFLLFYMLIAEVGPTRSSLVAYVAPGFSVLYGVFLLDESFTAATFAGLVLILGGSWLAAEARLPWQPKRVVAVAAPPTPEAAR